MVKRVVKKFISRRLIDCLHQVHHKVDLFLVIVASRYEWLSMLYYCVYSGEFRRETRAVLLARQRYYEAQNGRKPNSFLLRRNIHRLEKGLIMQPRRPVFGEGYIKETIRYFIVCVESETLIRSELYWAQDVLKEYFNAVQATEIIDSARQLFENSMGTLPKTDVPVSHSPQEYASLTSSIISFKEFKALCDRRHSVRWFEPKPVPSDLIEAAIDVAATAPSACNRQPFKFYVFDDAARAQEIGAIPMGTAGFSQNFQCVVVVVGDLSAYPFEKDRHIIYIDSGLAVMQLQLALETQGLGSCVINWPDIERHERLMAEELDLEPYQRPVMLLVVGYPQQDSLVPYSAKKASADLIERPK